MCTRIYSARRWWRQQYQSQVHKMTPRSRVQLCALLLAVAAAHARPDNNDIPVPTKSNEAENTKESVIDTKTSLADATTTTENPTTESLKPAEVFKAVNEKYPHALLFGATCGGTIISPKWVLTAGHCTLFTGGRYVLAGTNNTDDGSGVTRRVKRLVLHPLFTVGPYWVNADEFNIKQVAARWDFLLAELAEPLPLDGKTMVAASLNDEKDLPVGLEVDYAGYGTEHHGGTMRSDMHGMELAVQDNDMCKGTLEQYNPEDMLCTKGRPPNFDSACNGDSGSGLVDSSGKLMGVASWVEDDAHECRKGALVIFSRVSAVREWIRQVTKV